MKILLLVFLILLLLFVLRAGYVLWCRHVRKKHRQFSEEFDNDFE